jgi:Bles03-like protein
MKLRPELVPKPLFGFSAYRLLGRGAKWKAIRQDALRATRNRCSVCGAGGKGLSCHECWDYDDERRRATLTALVIHCPDCDMATHMGRAVQHGQEEAAVAQLCKVNGCAPDGARKLFAEAMKVWRHRSGYDWTTFVTDTLLTRYPALSVLHNKKVVNTLRPSEERVPFFLWAYARRTGYPAPTERSGKWLVYVPRSDVDEVWPKIREALDAGKLGECTKVSTARPNPNSPGPRRHVICVYTYDSDDVQDVKRVRASLRELGFVGRLSYKPDADTRAGRYKNRGHRGISKYLE